MKFLIVLALIAGALCEEVEPEFPIVEPEEQIAYLDDEHHQTLNDETELLMDLLNMNALPERKRGEEYFESVVSIHKWYSDDFRTIPTRYRTIDI